MLRRVWFEKRADDAPDEWYLAAAVDEALTAADRAPEAARLDGALLLADEAGRLLDLAAWIVYAPTPGPRVRYRTPVPVRPSRSGWRPVLDLLAAIVAWGD